MKTLIDRDTLNGVSTAFSIDEQVTVMAFGLQPGEEVTFWYVRLSQPFRDPCICPPGLPVLPSVLDEIPVLCCGVPVTLTIARPFVILDSPRGVKLRVKLETLDPLDGQYVAYQETSTPNINDRLRGCPCGQEGA